MSKSIDDYTYEKSDFFVGPPRPPKKEPVDGASVFRVVIVLLLAICLIRILANREAISFTSLLQYMSGAPAIPTDWLIVFDTDFASQLPGWLSWLGGIVDFFSSAMSLSIYTGVLGLNAITFLFYFLRWIFL